MAFVYHMFFHVLTENGEKTLISESEWGEKRLSGNDLDQYRTEIAEATTPIINEVNAGNIVIEDLEEQVTLSTGQQLQVKIGEKITFPNATSKFEFHPNFYKWAAVMKQDPNLNYKDPVWVDSTP